MRFVPLAAAALFVAVASATAADDPAATVKYRKVVMGSVGAHMKASSMIVKGKIGRTEDLVAHAQAMHDTSKFYANLFPEGTGPDKFPKTEALPKIWEDMDGFKKANQAFVDASAAFVEAAKSGDMEKIQPAMGKLGKSCGGCHDNYRLDD